MDTTLLGIIAGILGAAITKGFDLLIARMNKKDAQGKDIATNMTEQSRVLWDNQTAQILNLWKKLDETEDQLHAAQSAVLEARFYKDRVVSAEQSRDDALRKLADLEMQISGRGGTSGALPQAPSTKLLTDDQTS